MPTYVYRCENCGHRFEAWQHMTDDPLTTCPQCEGPIHRVLFPASIVFKGSGFYSTDNRRSQIATEPAATASEGGDGKSDAGKSDAAKSDSKPAADGGATSGGASSTGGTTSSPSSAPKAAATSN
jgi:putative FmdB family regulatory protein